MPRDSSRIIMIRSYQIFVAILIGTNRCLDRLQDFLLRCVDHKADGYLGVRHLTGLKCHGRCQWLDRTQRVDSMEVFGTRLLIKQPSWRRRRGQQRRRGWRLHGVSLLIAWRDDLLRGWIPCDLAGRVVEVGTCPKCIPRHLPSAGATSLPLLRVGFRLTISPVIWRRGMIVLRVAEKAAEI